MKGPETRAERNREKILQAALVLFQAQGLKKVTVNDVAEKAGVTPATVYNRFSNKDNLVYETVKYWYDSVIDEYISVITADKPFDEKMADLLIFKTSAAEKMHGEFTLIASSDEPPIRDHIQKIYMGEVIQALDRFFEEGRQQGYVDPNLSTAAIIRYTEFIRKGIQADTQADPDPDYTRNLVKELMPIMLYGILGNQDRHKFKEAEKE